MKRSLLFLILTLASLGSAATPGETQIERWHEGKTAAYMLMFDDSWPSHWQVAVPELLKRGLRATFYICPGKGEYLKFADKWEKELWQQGMAYGVHTMSHKGVKDMENAEYEIGENARVIRRIVPSTTSKLVSYAQPGVGQGNWNITREQLDELLTKHQLIERPSLKGKMTVYDLKTTEEIFTLVDKTIASQGCDILVIHGVERLDPNTKYQDFWALKQSIFLPLLDGLKQRQDEGKLWITDHISAHQYETERDTAAVRLTSVTDSAIHLELSCKADAKLYDHPLTLTTAVPASWNQCVVSQNGKTSSHDAKGEVLRFDAVPNAGEIVIKPKTP